MDTNQPPPEAPKDFDEAYDENYGGGGKGLRGQKPQGRKTGPSPNPDNDEYGLGTLERGARYGDDPDRRMNPTEELGEEEEKGGKEEEG